MNESHPDAVVEERNDGSTVTWLNDLLIIRKDGSIEVHDQDGDYLFNAPDRWSDDDILFADGIRSRAYDLGHMRGGKHRIGEVRSTLRSLLFDDEVQ